MSVGRDTGYNLVAALTPALFSIVVTPLYLHAIGPERYGVLAIYWGIVAALGFTSLGMGPAVAYQLARTEGAPATVSSRLVWTALTLALAASLLGVLLVVAIGRIYFGRFFPPAPGIGSEIRNALPLLALMLPLAVLAGVLNGALQGTQRFRALSAIIVVNSAISLVIPLAAAYFIGVQLNVLVLSSVCASGAVLIFQFLASARLIRLAVRPELSLADAKALLGYGGWMSATALIAPLVLLIDRFVIGALRGPTAVAIYVLPYSLVQQMVFLPASLSSAILPRLAPLPPGEEAQQLQSSSLRWLNGMLTPLAIVAIALATPFFRLWIGPELGSAASPVAVILLVGAWSHGIGHIPSTVLIARGRPDLLTKLLLAYLIPYVVLLYFATERFGIIGAAAVWTLRAAFDPVLFLFTRPSRADMRTLAISAALAFAAMVVALALAWTSPFYWAAMALIGGGAVYQSRAVLIAFASRLLSRDWNAAEGPMQP